MSSQTSSSEVHEMVDVDIKKTDYTIRNWEDTEDLKEELKEAKSDKSEIIKIVEDHGSGIRPVMHVLGRAPGGTRVHVRVHGVKPYFYVPFDDFGEELKNDDKVIEWKKGFENIQGEHMVKVVTRIPGDVPKLRNDYDHHEADILFPNRFLIDEGIEGSIRIPKEHVGPEPTDISVREIKDSNYNQKSRICFADIEVDDSKGFPSQERAEKEIVCITVHDNYMGEYQIFLYHPEFPEVSHGKARIRMYENEVNMLEAFVEYIKLRDFDVITGWNFTDFDSRYIINRLDNLSDREDVNELSQSSISKLGSAYDDGWFGAKIKGMSVFDMLMGYKNLQFTELDSFRLEDVAQEELGVGKIKDNRSIYELWENEPQKLVDYNVKDVELTVMLEQEQNIIKFYEEIANYVGGRLGEVVDASKAVDIKVLRAVNGRWAVPSAKNVETEEFEGAKVFDPVMGVKNNVVVLDLASLYPMSMKTINAGPETKDPDGELVAPNGVRFNNDQDAVVVEIIDEMLEERQRYKDLRDEHPPDSDMYAIYDRKQTAVKVVMNTLYGVMGWDRFRLQDKDVGAAVTAVGRECIKFTEQVVEDMGYEAIYGDTDSVMVKLDDDLTKEEVKEIGFELEEKINEEYDRFAKEELNADEHFFDIEFEKLYRRFFQAGKKKRYAGHITWKEGKDKDSLDIVGFEYQRSDYSRVAKELMERVFNHILRGGDLDDLSKDVNELIDKLKNEEYEPDEFGIPASVTKDFDDYDTETVAVKGSKYANEHFDAEIQPGDKPKMNYVKRIVPDSEGNIPFPMPDEDSSKAQPCCWMNYDVIPDELEWDWDEYIDKQIKSPIARILQGTDWSWSEVITGKRQPRLGEYEFTDEAADSDNGPASFKSPKENPTEVEPLDEDDMFSWERQEIRAKRQLQETQGMLDEWEDGDEEESAENVVEANMKNLDEGPTDLDDFI